VKSWVRATALARRCSISSTDPIALRRTCSCALRRRKPDILGQDAGSFSFCGARIRYQQTGEFHFLTFSCYHRRAYLSQVAAMELFEDALERVRQRYKFVVTGYVVMPEHVHLLVNEPGRAFLSRTQHGGSTAFKLRRCIADKGSSRDIRVKFVIAISEPFQVRPLRFRLG
jgi:hypothetical protein